MEIHRSYYYYTSSKDDANVEDAIRDAGRFGKGFWKIFKIIRRQGHTWNHKKVYRVYKSLHFEKRSRLKKRLPARVKTPLTTPEEPNTTWSIGFVSDVVESGRKFRVMNVLDDADRTVVAQEISISMPAQRVVRLLDLLRTVTYNDSMAVTDVPYWTPTYLGIWMSYYNTERPHDALEDMAPLQYREFLLSGS